MNKTLMALLVSGFLIGGMQTAFAGDSIDGGNATERDPYCENEDNGAAKDYDGIGWSTGDDDGEQGYVPPNWQPAGADGPTISVCEGEHWDGQDSLSDKNAGHDNHPSGECIGTDGTTVAVGQCRDPNDHGDTQIVTPVGLRVSHVAAGDGSSAAVYDATRISGVGHAVLFVSYCTAGGTEQGHEGGNTACEGDVGEAAVGVYLMDNTPFQLNTLAAAVSAARLTKGYVSDGDCSQEEYETSAYVTNSGETPGPDNGGCGRDNTAISTEISL